MDSVNESAWEQRMQAMEQNLERTREELAGRDTEDEETRALVQQMLERLVSRLCTATPCVIGRWPFAGRRS